MAAAAAIAAAGEALRIRAADDRGLTELGWLHSRHTFSFGGYVDPAHMGFRSLRVINDDVVEPGFGFDLHGHRDMEIISVVLEGALQHHDSLGHTSTLRAGEIQVMSAGRGIRHSETNASRDERVHFLQVWIMPAAQGLEPRWRQEPLPQLAGDAFVTVVQGVATPAPAAGAPGAPLTIHQQADILMARPSPGQRCRWAPPTGRAGWLHVATGAVDAGGTRLRAGDAAAFEPGEAIECAGADSSSLLILFSVA